MRVDSNVYTPIALNDEGTQRQQTMPSSPNIQQKGQGVNFGQSSDAINMGSLGNALSGQAMEWDNQKISIQSFFKKMDKIQSNSLNNLNGIISTGMKELEQISATARTVAPLGATYSAAKDPAVLATIDNSKYSSPEELKKWDKMVANLPPEKRQAAEKELNRPYAAAMLAQEKGDTGEKARAFIDANPALRTAADTAEGGKYSKADGKITKKDLKIFANTLKDRMEEASGMMDNYQEKHPQADEQSMSIVRSAALMYANDPIIRSASADKSCGVDGQQDTKYTNIKDLNALADTSNNPGLSSQLTDAASLWSKPGMYNILDDLGLRGKDVARHGGDQLVSHHDFSSFIENMAPANASEFADFMSYSAMSNATAKIDTSKLDGDIFDHPNQYTGAAKAAILMRLERTNEYVIAGRDIRDTEDTEKELQEKIEQLNNDADVQHFLEKEVKENKKEIINSSADLSNSVSQHIQNDVLTGNSLSKSLQPKDGSPLSATQVTHALDGFNDEVQLSQDLMGSHVEVSDIVEQHPELAEKLRRASAEVTSGDLLTHLAKKDGTSVEDALSGYWTCAAYLDDALSKSSGGIDIPRGDKLKTALSKAGIDPNQLENVRGPVLSALMNHQDDMLAKQFGELDTRSGNPLLKSAKKAFIKKGAKAAAKQGAKYATRLVASMAGRAVAAAAGEMAGAAMAGTISAAAGPIGAIAGAAVTIGFGVAELVSFFKGKAKRRKERRDFDRTVSPLLNQLGIVKPK